MSVALLMGSDSDFARLEPGVALLKKLGIPCEARVLSAHRTPKAVVQFVEAAPKRGIQVFLCAAGGAAHLAGVVAAHTDLPVIGIPMDNPPLGGLAPHLRCAIEFLGQRQLRDASRPATLQSLGNLGGHGMSCILDHLTLAIERCLDLVAHTRLLEAVARLHEDHAAIPPSGETTTSQ